MSRWIERHWQRDTVVSRLLLPLSALYRLSLAINRWLYRSGWRHRVSFAVPIVVVGNITVGGTGKTPLVAWIVQTLAANGWRPGIITRGYRGRARTWPQLVTAHSNPALVGDEPVLLARHTGVPVVADRDRARGVRWLLAHECDVVVSDDGLQHYRLGRDVEIAVVDGTRRFGNGRCLPAGPLREPPSRLAAFDARVIHGGDPGTDWSMALVPASLRRVRGDEATALEAFRGRELHAVAGIGYPPRFFALLRTLGIEPIEHPFPDHHRFRPEDFGFADGRDIIMTEKDAVKCRDIVGRAAWYLAVDARVDPSFGDWLLQRLRNKRDGQKTARHPGMPGLQGDADLR